MDSNINRFLTSMWIRRAVSCDDINSSIKNVDPGPDPKLLLVSVNFVDIHTVHVIFH